MYLLPPVPLSALPENSSKELLVQTALQAHSLELLVDTSARNARQVHLSLQQAQQSALVVRLVIMPLVLGLHRVRLVRLVR